MLIEQLRTDLETFTSETQDLSRQNEELMSARDADSILIRDLSLQVKEYKRKYEQAKTELRSVKGKRKFNNLRVSLLIIAIFSYFATLPPSTQDDRRSASCWSIGRPA